MRINKYLGECGLCSRREADELVKAGLVLINGKVAEHGAQVQETDEVCVRGKAVRPLLKKIYLVFNKPKGIVCTAEKREKNNLVDYLKFERRITYAGRLDKESEGLLILTDDGGLIDALMSAKNGHEKEYVVKTYRPISDEQLENLGKGVYLKEIDRLTLPCKVWRSDENEFHVVLTQGINRQIRRMCKNVGLSVKELKRIRIENISLGDLPCGRYRELNDSELKELRSRLWKKDRT